MHPPGWQAGDMRWPRLPIRNLNQILRGSGSSSYAPTIESSADEVGGKPPCFLPFMAVLSALRTGDSRPRVSAFLSSSGGLR